MSFLTSAPDFTRSANPLTRPTGAPWSLSVFSCVYVQALNYDEGYSRQSVCITRENSSYVSCELTKSEFAECLGLQADSMFVTNMFKMVDKNDNGYISFREFLDFFVIFKKGAALFFFYTGYWPQKSKPLSRIIIKSY